MPLRLERGLKRVGIGVGALLLVAFALTRGFTLILRYQPKRALSATRTLFGRVLNPLLLWFSDRFDLDQSVVYHIGRTSGREYATPLCVSPTPDGFIVPVAFGPDVNWLANLRASPVARLMHKGVTYAVEAEVIDADEAVRSAGGSPACPCWKELRVQDFVRLRPVDGVSGKTDRPDPLVESV